MMTLDEASPNKFLKVNKLKKAYFGLFFNIKI